MGVEATCFQYLCYRRRNPLAYGWDIAQPPLSRNVANAPRIKTQRLSGARECPSAKWTLARDLEQAAMALQDVSDCGVRDAGVHDALATWMPCREFCAE